MEPYEARSEGAEVEETRGDAEEAAAPELAELVGAELAEDEVGAELAGDEVGVAAAAGASVGARSAGAKPPPFDDWTPPSFDDEVKPPSWDGPADTEEGADEGDEPVSAIGAASVCCGAVSTAAEDWTVLPSGTGSLCAGAADAPESV